MTIELTSDEQMVLERVVAKPELQPHFFGKIKNLKWFGALKEKGLLEPSLNPLPVNTEGDYWSVPSWPLTEYLVRSAEVLLLEENVEHAKAYLTLIREVAAYAKVNGDGNHRTWWQFSKVLKLLPVALVSPEDIELCDFWLGDRFDRFLIAKELGEWLELLLDAPDEHSHQLAMLLLDKLFLVAESQSKYDANKKEPTIRIDKYWAGKLVEKVASKAGAVLGQQAVELFEVRLCQILDISGNDKWSVIWRHAIEKHEQDSGRDDLVDILLDAYRDAFLAWYQGERGADTEANLQNALDSPYQVIQRTAIYVAYEKYWLLHPDTVAKIITPAFFKDKYRYELWTLLNKHFNEFDEPLKQSTLQIIDDQSFFDDDGNVEKRPTAYHQSLWYSAIKDNDASAKALYDKCVGVTEKEPEHPSFSSYSSVSVGTHESPVSLVELKVMLQEPEKMVNFLNDYDHVGHFNEPGIEGLVKAFGELIEAEGKEIFNHCQHLLLLKPHYLHEIFAAFDRFWNAKQELDWPTIWPKLLNFAYETLIQDGFWSTPVNEPYGVFIGDSHWVVSKLGYLIQAGCKKDNHALGIANIGAAKKVIELILQRQPGEEFELDADAVSVAINSPRGRCLEAYINLALYECRNLKANTADHTAAWQSYEAVFWCELNKPDNDEFEFAALAPMYLSNFLYLSDTWLSANLEQIFGEKCSQRWICALQGYSYVNGFHDEVYSLFKRKQFFENLLDSPHLNDEIKDRYIQFIGYCHIHNKERLGADGDPLSLLLDRCHYKELKKLIWQLWSIHDDDKLESNELVYKLWPTLVARAAQGDKEGQLLASKLCLWIVYIDELDADTISWLSTIAPYAGKDYNADTFLEGLARLSGTYPLEVAEIWKLMLTNYSTVFADESIQTLFNNIYAASKDGQRAARDIADLYLKFGASGIVNIYRQLVEAM
ncbi:hypothetical protein L2737_05090 [Shewanella electrodiphila]|uniref:DUF4020 domain-containing protein n=1 Tax=Shewanella electrodiphila TaxID=934143 RepID=A0ABT0KLJ3_9GAMM|nr:hypothetical protein [Shewanella electrodiphila]MCL1044703.1 hypothetical protein [Shewanella electrodiphila]